MGSRQSYVIPIVSNSNGGCGGAMGSAIGVTGQTIAINGTGCGSCNTQCGNQVVRLGAVRCRGKLF